MGSAPVEASHKVTLGVSIEHDSRVEATFETFTQDVGGIQPRLWTLWSTWGNANTREFPRAAADWVASKGARPLIFWEPFKAFNSCEFARHAKIAAGQHDAYIRQWARAAKAYGKTVLVRYAHEINASFFPWTTRFKFPDGSDCGNTAANFKQGWRHVVGIFRKERATNVKFVWTVAKKTCASRGCNPYKNHYPGDRWVHYAGFSSFNWGAQKGNWVPMLDGVAGIMKRFNEFTRKPIVIAELATNTDAPSSAPDSATKPNWIRNGYPAVYKKFHQIKVIMYLNVDLSYIGHPDWSLNTPREESHQAYGNIADQARFKGRIR